MWSKIKLLSVEFLPLDIRDPLHMALRSVYNPVENIWFIFFSSSAVVGQLERQKVVNIVPALQEFTVECKGSPANQP